MIRFVNRSSIKGFTLIELLVVVAIIGILASVVLASLNSARAKGRDAYRKSALKQVQNALELYYNDYGAYPIAINASGDSWNRWFSSEPDDHAPENGGDWIPELVAGNYISSLPEDPRGGTSLYAQCNYVGQVWKSAFLYASNGTNYKLVSHCAPEGAMTAGDTFIDTYRPNWAWMVTNKRDSPPGGCSGVYNFDDNPDYPICW